MKTYRIMSRCGNSIQEVMCVSGPMPSEAIANEHGIMRFESLEDAEKIIIVANRQIGHVVEEFWIEEEEVNDEQN